MKTPLSDTMKEILIATQHDPAMRLILIASIEEAKRKGKSTFKIHGKNYTIRVNGERD